MAYSLVRIHNYSNILADDIGWYSGKNQTYHDALRFWIAVFSNEVAKLKDLYSEKLPHFDWSFYAEVGNDCSQLLKDGAGRNTAVDLIIGLITEENDMSEESNIYEYGISVFNLKVIIHFCVNELNLLAMEINKTDENLIDHYHYPIIDNEKYLQDLN
jgi:hypothetical protein